MNFLDLNDDVKIIIAKHCTSDYFISTMFISRQNVCLFKKKPKSRRNWFYDKFYSMIHFNNANIELIENFPCDNVHELIRKKNEVIKKMIKKIKINQNE